jgi:hypothetical protein
MNSRMTAAVVGMLLQSEPVMRGRAASEIVIPR